MRRARERRLRQQSAREARDAGALIPEPPRRLGVARRGARRHLAAFREVAAADGARLRRRGKMDDGLGAARRRDRDEALADADEEARAQPRRVAEAARDKAGM